VASAAGILGISMDEVERQLAATAATGDTSGPAYTVFVLRAGKPQAVRIHAGISSLTHTEVTSGLSEADTVLLLPTASLVASQQNLRERAQRLGGAALPGVQRWPTTPGTSGAGARAPGERR
jgi:hypothetical protein